MALKDDIDRFLASQQQERGGLAPARFSTPSSTPAASGGKPDAFGGGMTLTAPGSRDYLGTATQIDLSGTSDVDVTAGPGALPSAATGAGAGGGLGGSSRQPGGGGPSDLALALKGLGAGMTVADFVGQFMGGPERGNVGGEGQMQRSDQSFSDRLRSLSGPASGLTLGPDFNQTLTPAGEGMSSFDAFRENLPPGGGAPFGGGFTAETSQLLRSLSASTGIPVEQLAALPVDQVSDVLMGGTTAPLEAGAAGGSGLGGLTNALGSAGTALTVAKALFDIGQIAAGSGSDEEKAIQATKVATTAAASIAAPATFGASLAVMQIWDMVDRLRAGQGGLQSVVSANDPTAMFDLGGGGGLSGMIFNPSKHWQSFVPGLMQNVSRQGTAFQTLGQALPYVQSKEELGRLLNTYNNYVGMTTGLTPERYGSIEGAGDVYSIGKIPGVGPETHGIETPPVDFGPATRGLWDQITQLYNVLPGDPITARYGQPGGGLEGEAANRLWRQFVGIGTNAPAYLPQDIDRPRMRQVDEGGQMAEVGRDRLSRGFYGPGQLASIGGDLPTIAYGQPGYDYSGAGLPEPGQRLGSVSPHWQQLMAAQQAEAAQRAQVAQRALGAFGRGGAFPGGGFGPTGMLTEEQRRRLGVG